MLLTYGELTVRNAVADDAGLLAKWWNDGTVMAHAGFPRGLGITPEEVAEKLKEDSDSTGRRLILERRGLPIGEMNYRRQGKTTAGIGIKICDFSQQEKGYGRVYLSLLISRLFGEMGYDRIVLDTNLKNLRAQHVYEKLGFRKIRVSKDAWRDQTGELQSVVDYELFPEDFVNFAE